MSEAERVEVVLRLRNAQKSLERSIELLDKLLNTACFDAGGNVYEVTKDGQVIDRNSFRDEAFREKLWDRVRKRS